MKIFIGILSFALVCGVVLCEDDVAATTKEDTDADSPADQELASPKTKRGIFHHGYGAHPLTYEVPLGTAAYPHYGFQKPWHHVSYAKAPAVYSPSLLAPAVHHHAVHHHPVVHAVPAPQAPHYVITPGGASVTSYNVNYPRYQYINKPHVDIPISVPIPRPTPTLFLQSKPIVPVAVPAFSNRIPIRPTYHVLPSIQPAPVYPVATPIQPQFVQVPLPAHPVHAVHAVHPVQPTLPTLPTAFSTVPTTTSTVIPQFVGNAQPTDQWRPIFVSQQQPTPTTPTFSSAHRPAISLLPPFGASGGAAGLASPSDQQAIQQQFEFQQQYENNNEYAEQQQQQYQPPLNQLYASPANDNSLDTSQDFIQGNQLQQQYEQQQQQRAIIQEQQQIHAGGSFNGQGYEPPSNNGHYSGPSSYEVQLNSYTRAI